jgi:hypothetical protein
MFKIIYCAEGDLKIYFPTPPRNRKQFQELISSSNLGNSKPFVRLPHCLLDETSRNWKQRLFILLSVSLYLLWNGCNLSTLKLKLSCIVKGLHLLQEGKNSPTSFCAATKFFYHRLPKSKRRTSQHWNPLSLRNQEIQFEISYWCLIIKGKPIITKCFMWSDMESSEARFEL